MSPDDYLRQRLEDHLAEIEGKEELIALLVPLLAMGARQSATNWQGLREEVAQAVVLALKDDVDRHMRISWEGAFERAYQIIAIGESRQDIGIQALGMMANGDALKLVTERLEEAWSTYEHAGKLYYLSKLPPNEQSIGWARTRIGRVYLCAEIGKIEQGLAEAEEARIILEREKVWGRLVWLHVGWARALYTLNAPSEALLHYHHALDVANRLESGSEAYLTTIYSNMANIQKMLGQTNEALDTLLKCARIWESYGELGAAALVRQNIARIYMEGGLYARALSILHELDPILQVNYPHAWISLLRNLVICYTALNRPQDAHKTVERLLAIKGASSADHIRTLYYIAQLELSTGNIATALSTLETAIEYAQELGAEFWLTNLRLRGSEIALQNGESEKALKEASGIRQYWETQANTFYMSEASSIETEALLALGEYVSAYQRGQATLSIARKNHTLPQQYKAHFLLGKIEEAQGHRNRTRRHYQAAVATAARIQRGLSHSLTADVGSSQQGAFHGLMNIELQNKQVQTAFTLLEAIKSRLFISYLYQKNRLRWEVTSQTAPLLTELASLRSRHFELSRANDSFQDNQTLTELHSTEARLRWVTDRLYLYSAQTEFQWANLPSLQDVQSTLSSDSALLEFYDNGQSVWCFVITAQSIVVHTLTINPAQLKELIERIYENVRSTVQLYLPHEPQARLQLKKIRQDLTGLGRALLGPIMGLLPSLQRLYVVPYGILHRLPFNLLRANNGYLIQQVEVVTLPTASLLGTPPVIASRGNRWVGHSQVGKIPNAVAEIDLLQSQWGGEHYSESTATSDVLQLSPCQVLHISTHGIHRVDHHFDLSYLALADRNIFEDDLLQMDLSYELVTLSACETGSNKPAPGEELIGLGRAFLYAGAGAIVASLWQVRDDNTLTLMNTFYNTLFSGATKASALREAQITLLSLNPTLHPAFWGAFQLVGSATAISS